MRRVFTDEQESRIAGEYAAGESSLALSRRYGTSSATICGAVRRAGGRVRPHAESNKGNFRNATESQRILTPAQRKEAAALYAKGWSTTKLGDRYGVRHDVIGRAIRSVGGDIRTRTRRHQINEAAFDDAERNEFGAYFAGLLFADGCVRWRRGHGELQISLSGDDGQLLRRLRDFLQSTHPIQERDNKRSVGRIVGRAKKPIASAQRVHKFYVQSNRLVEQLAKYNIVPRKSLTAVVPDVMLDNPHWWRGCIDGDGWVISESAKDGIPILGFCGSKTAVEQFRDFVYRLVPGKPLTVRGGTCHSVAVSGRRAAAVIRALYADCSVALPRKLAIAREILVRYKGVPAIRTPNCSSVCETHGCDRPVLASSLCSPCYRRAMRARLKAGIRLRPVCTRSARLPCSSSECDRPVYAKSLCHRHYYRQLHQKIRHRKRSLAELAPANPPESAPPPAD